MKKLDPFAGSGEGSLNTSSDDESEENRDVLAEMTTANANVVNSPYSNIDIDSAEKGGLSYVNLNLQNHSGL
jgi:hypothetical protein